MNWKIIFVLIFLTGFCNIVQAQDNSQIGHLNIGMSVIELCEAIGLNKYSVLVGLAFLKEGYDESRKDRLRRGADLIDALAFLAALLVPADRISFQPAVGMRYSKYWHHRLYGMEKVTPHISPMSVWLIKNKVFIANEISWVRESNEHLFFWGLSLGYMFDFDGVDMALAIGRNLEGIRLRRRDWEIRNKDRVHSYDAESFTFSVTVFLR